MKRASIEAALGSPQVIRASGDFKDDFVFRITRAKDGSLILTMLEPCRVKTRFGEATIPKGLESDGASIPNVWVIRKLVGDPFDNHWIRQGVLHDYGYRDLSIPGAYLNIDKAEWDIILKDTMYNSKVTKWKVDAFYLAVHYFGGSSYKKKKYLSL